MDAPITEPERDEIRYAETRLGLEMSELAILQRAVELLFRIAHSRAYEDFVDPEAAAIARHPPGSFGVFMGYDFHLTAAGPRLIEVNTNAGGALVNGIRSLELCNRDSRDLLCCDPPLVEDVEQRLIETFQSEWRGALRQNGSGESRALARIAIADENPVGQFLYPEFKLFAELFARHGIAATICDSSGLEAGADGGIEVDGQPIDLVYWRDTDFYLQTARARALRDAYLERRVVVTPAPREHHLLADKRRLQIFSSQATLEQLGVSADDAAFLAEIVPQTLPLEALGIERAWRERRDWVFKPAAAYGSKAVYRGDKITRPKLNEIFQLGGFLAQRLAEPGLTRLDTPDGPRQMKFDIRAYAYRDEILLLGARVYRGQVTNLRTPGGGFSAICVARDGAR